MTIPQSFAWCSWRGDFSGTCRLVQIIEQGSGTGGGRFACGPCREEHSLTPVADQPCTPGS
ncbi:hypothetical protein ABZ782_28110 [Streptomyces asoensis]|uniref:hypothetical protein n=1 Tax=Streptomyces asoensis TaxID=249586 RepID=UPI0033FEF1C4